MNKRLFNTSLLAGLMASLGLGSSALAQAYPTKPLRVVPWARARWWKTAPARAPW